MNTWLPALTLNELPHLWSWTPFRVRINLSRMTSILTHVLAGTTPEVEAQILWCKIAGTHFRVDSDIGTVGWSGGGHYLLSISRQVNIMAISLFLRGYSMRSVFPESTFSFYQSLRIVWDQDLQPLFNLAIPVQRFSRYCWLQSKMDCIHVWKSLRLVGCGLEMVINIVEHGRLNWRLQIAYK